MAEDTEKGRQEDGEKRLPRFSPFSLAPILLVFLALALRLPGLGWGLPNVEHWYSYHPDERQIAIAVSNVANDFNPHFFNYPSLFIYLTYFAYLLQTMLGLNTAAAGSAPWPIFHDILFCGRLISALLGAFTVPAVYLIGQQFTKLAAQRAESQQEPREALKPDAIPIGFGFFAAFLMAVAPGHVQHSHFATVDVPATFFVAWSLYFALLTVIEIPGRRAKAKRPLDAEDFPAGGFNPRFLLFSAFLAGLAAATKYNAGLVLIAPIMALFAGHFERKGLLFCGALVVAAFGFVLGCPHSILSTGEFLGNRENSGLLYELLVHPRQGQDNIFTNTGNGWIYHLTFNLPFAFTAPGAICAVIGLFIAARSKNKLWWPLLAFAGLYFLTLGFSQVRFMRYDFPLLPVLCLSAALGLFSLPKRIRTEAVLGCGLLMLVGATNVLYPFCVSDPRDQAAAYIKSKVTQPVTIALINRPWFYTPPLWPQDYPPPSQVMSGVSPDGKFRFEVVGFDGVKAYETGLMIINQFEEREYGRLQNPEYTKHLMPELCCGANFDPFKDSFHNQPPFELSGRRFVPHDFLYSNPYVQIYRFSHR